MAWHPVASIADAERARPWLPAEIAATEMEATEVVLARIDGDWFAVQGRCTHAGCAFDEDATLEDETIVCSCHGSEFDLRTGAVLRGPAERPLRTYAVRVAGGTIEVAL